MQIKKHHNNFLLLWDKDIDIAVSSSLDKAIWKALLHNCDIQYTLSYHSNMEYTTKDLKCSYVFDSDSLNIAAGEVEIASVKEARSFPQITIYGYISLEVLRTIGDHIDEVWGES